MTTSKSTVRVPCAGVVVHDTGRLLLIRRGTEPGRGLWSVPGGRVEPGESPRQAAVREAAEETGLTVDVGRSLGVVERAGLGNVVYVIEDFLATPATGVCPADARAGDDAEAVGWFRPAELSSLPCVAGLLEAFQEWGVLSDGQHPSDPH